MAPHWSIACAGRSNLQWCFSFTQAELGSLDQGFDDEPSGDGDRDVHDLVAMGKDVEFAAEESLRGMGRVKEGTNQLEQAHQAKCLNNVPHLWPVENNKVSKRQAPKTTQQYVYEGT